MIKWKLFASLRKRGTRPRNSFLKLGDNCLKYIFTKGSSQSYNHSVGMIESENEKILSRRASLISYANPHR